MPWQGVIQGAGWRGDKMEGKMDAEIISAYLHPGTVPEMPT